MGSLEENDQWVFYVENIHSKDKYVDDQWKSVRLQMLQELNLMEKVPEGFSCELTPEMKNYIECLSD
jgi:hypothetical protein